MVVNLLVSTFFVSSAKTLVTGSNPIPSNATTFFFIHFYPFFRTISSQASIFEQINTQMGSLYHKCYQISFVILTKDEHNLL